MCLYGTGITSEFEAADERREGEDAADESEIISKNNRAARSDKDDAKELPIVSLPRRRLVSRVKCKLHFVCLRCWKNDGEAERRWCSQWEPM